MILEKEVERLREDGYHGIADKVEMTVKSLVDKETWLVHHNERLQRKCFIYKQALEYSAFSCATDTAKVESARRALITAEVQKCSQQA